MKFSAASLLLLTGYASAGKPELSFTLKDGSYNDVKSAVAPTVSFEGESGGTEFGGSVDLGSDGLPKSVWGQKTTDVGSGWSLKARAELSQGSYEFPNGEDTGAYVTVEGSNEEENAYVWGSGHISKENATLKRLGAKKVITLDEGKILIAPRYDFHEQEPTVVVGFEKDDTKAYATLSQEDQNLLVEHKINDDNSASIKAGTDGLISASVQNDSDLGSTTVTYTPGEVDIEIKNDGWVAGISSSTAGLLDSEPVIRFSKTVTFRP